MSGTVLSGNILQFGTVLSGTVLSGTVLSGHAFLSVDAQEFMRNIKQALQQAIEELSKLIGFSKKSLKN